MRILLRLRMSCIAPFCPLPCCGPPSPKVEGEREGEDGPLPHMRVDIGSGTLIWYPFTLFHC